ncbi:MAG: MerR family DNA-binding protein [Actinobacteria bacterium]|nr:MerR family DNA-binding protein [Actinomycetota bacterium]
MGSPRTRKKRAAARATGAAVVVATTPHYPSGRPDILAFIKTAQRLGITLDEIREILTLRDRGERPCGYVRDVLRREVAAVDNRLVELRQLRRQLIELDRLADACPRQTTDSPASSSITCAPGRRRRRTPSGCKRGVWRLDTGSWAGGVGPGESPGSPRTSSRPRSPDRRTADDHD